MMAKTKTLKESLSNPYAYLWFAVSILFFLVLLFSKSRSGVLGLSLGFSIYWLFTLIISRRKKVALSWFGAVSGILLTLYLLFGKAVVPQIDNLLSNLKTTSTVQAPAPEEAATPAPSGTQLEVGGTESGTIRQIVWTGAINLFKRYPLFGSGVETYAYGYYNVRPSAHNLVSEWDFLYNKAHNEWLNVLSTTGLVGITTYLGFIVVYSLWLLKNIINQDQKIDTKMLLVAQLSGFWALNVSNFLGFSTVPVGLIFFVFPAISLGLTGRSSVTFASNKQSSNYLTKSLNGAQYAFISLISIIAIISLLQVSRMYRADLAYASGKAYQDKKDLLSTISFFEKAYKIDANEPLYTDQLSLSLAQAASVLNQQGQSTQAANLAQQAVIFSNLTIENNNVHLNFYKTRARVFIHLTALDANYLYEAQKALNTAQVLSPTDPKIVFNLGLIQQQLGNKEEAFKYFLQSVKLKPNYQDVRIALAKAYEEQGDITKAKEQYQHILDFISPADKVSQENLERLNSPQ